jgi:MFS family permease
VFSPTLRASTERSFEREDDWKRHENHNILHREITGIAILRTPEFYQLFLMLGLLAGVGLMTINNIGNDAKALWGHYDDSASHDFVQDREQMQVSFLSLCSFAGRFVSGVGSDYLNQKLRMSRFWCLVISATVFTVAQICALQVENPHFLYLVSCLTGLGYGALFGVFPALTADAFGVQGLSLNWGLMIFAPVVSGYIYNLIYGHVYDNHSAIHPGGKRDCPDGLHCYAGAYYVTLASSIVGIFVALWCIRYEHVKKQRAIKDNGHESFREA